MAEARCSSVGIMMVDGSVMPVRRRPQALDHAARRLVGRLPGRGATADALALSRDELVQLARNSFEASFVSDAQKQVWYDALDAYLKNA